MNISHDAGKFLSLLHPSGVYEIRSLKVPEWKGGNKLSTFAGWFTDHSQAVKAIAELEAKQPKAIYCTLNQCDPSLMGRAANRLKVGGTTTADENIERRTALLFDLDPERLADTNSTDDQMAAALHLADVIRCILSDAGWPDPISGMSGNGATLLYRVDLPNDPASLELVQSLLTALSDMFSTPVVKVDTGMINAARICKVLGTMTRKGEHVVGLEGIPDMPQRQSWFYDMEGPLEVVPVELIQAIAAKAPKPEAKPKKSGSSTVQRDPSWLDDWITQFNIPVGSPMNISGGGRKWFFEDVPPPCTSSPSGHECDGGQFIIERGDGTIQAGCHHSRCKWWNWKDLRLSYEPDAYDWEENQRHAESPEFQRAIDDVYKSFDKPKADQPQREQQSTEQPKAEQPKAESQESPVTHCAAEVLDGYMARLKSGKLPQLIRQYSALSGIEVGPELITVLAAYPGKGKTALTSQIMFDGMELDPELRAVVANAETGFDVLIRRQLSRLTSIPSRNIRFGNLTDYDVQQLNDAAEELRPKLARVEVLAKPFKLAQLMRLANTKPGLLIVDYLQKFIPHEAKDPRIGVNMVMDGLRELASVGWAVIAISATNRPGKEALAKLSMNSLRESSEIEFQADSIYLLNDDGPVDESRPWIRNVTLDHAKNRHDKPDSKTLVFNQPRMEFTAQLTEHESQFAGDFEQPTGKRNAFAGGF